MPSQKAGASLATRQNDGRLRRNKDAQRGTVAGDTREDKECANRQRSVRARQSDM